MRIWKAFKRLLSFWQKRRGRDKMLMEVPGHVRLEPTISRAELTLIRNVFTDKSTVGELMINGQLECYVLEDPIRKIKIPKVTAIPEGKYEIIITQSNRFKIPLPLLLNVPHFAGIRIHPGNYPGDTDGCLLPGRNKGKDYVGLSRIAFASLYPKIEAMLKEKKVFIEIINERGIG